MTKRKGESWSEYYVREKDRFSANTKRWRKENRDKAQEYSHAYYEDPEKRMKMLAYAAMQRCRKSGSTEYDRDYLFSIQPVDKCSCCGCDLDYTLLENPGKRNRKRRQNGPSFDRLLPNLGYVAGNVFVVCNRCNLLKRDATEDDLRTMLKYVTENTLNGEMKNG